MSRGDSAALERIFRVSMAQDGGVGNAVQEGGMIFAEGLEM
jgi:hypothetical protein